MSDEAPLEFQEGRGPLARRVAMNRYGIGGVSRRAPWIPWTEVMSVSHTTRGTEPAIAFDVREGGRWIRRPHHRRGAGPAGEPRHYLEQGGFDANTFNRILSFALLYLQRYGAGSPSR